MPEAKDFVLDETQRNYLRSLLPNPVWRSILAALAQHPTMPAFRKTADDAHAQFYGWVFESGRLHGYNQMLHLLSNGKASLQKPFIDTEET